MQVTCNGCGATFETIRSQIERRSGGKFCSRPCYADHRARHKQTPFEKSLRTKYDLSLAEYTAIYERQGGACAGCHKPAPLLGRGRLCVDHDHVTGVVRGLLCTPCNVALGWLEDDVDRMRRLIDYLAGTGAAAGSWPSSAR